MCIRDRAFVGRRDDELGEHFGDRLGERARAALVRACGEQTVCDTSDTQNNQKNRTAHANMRACGEHAHVIHQIGVANPGHRAFKRTSGNAVLEGERPLQILGT